MGEAGRKAAPGRPAKKGSPNTDTLSKGKAADSKGRAAESAAKLVNDGKTSVLAAELIEPSGEPFTLPVVAPPEEIPWHLLSPRSSADTSSNPQL